MVPDDTCTTNDVALSTKCTSTQSLVPKVEDSLAQTKQSSTLGRVFAFFSVNKDDVTNENEEQRHFKSVSSRTMLTSLGSMRTQNMKSMKKFSSWKRNEIDPSYQDLPNDTLPNQPGNDLTHCVEKNKSIQDLELYDNQEGNQNYQSSFSSSHHHSEFDVTRQNQNNVTILKKKHMRIVAILMAFSVGAYVLVPSIRKKEIENSGISTSTTPHPSLSPSVDTQSKIIEHRSPKEKLRTSHTEKSFKQSYLPTVLLTATVQPSLAPKTSNPSNVVLSPSFFPQKLETLNPSTIQISTSARPSEQKWILMSTVETPFHDEFDFSLSQYVISISDDARRLAFGAPFVKNSTGAVTIFHYRSADTTAIIPYIISNNSTLSSSSNRTNDKKVFDPYLRTSTSTSQDGLWEVAATLFGKSENDEFGSSISMSKGGSEIAIGAIKRNGKGYVQVYAESIQTMSDMKKSTKYHKIGDDIESTHSIQTDNQNNGEPGSMFGHSVSLSRNGKTIAIGEPWANTDGKPRSGRVEVLVWTSQQSQQKTGAWVRLGMGLDGVQLNDWFGYSVSLDNKHLAVGAPKGSSVCVYVLNDFDSTWKMIGHEIRGKHPKDMFGYQVVLSQDAKKLGIGAPRDPQVIKDGGSAVVYELFNNMFYIPAAGPFFSSDRACLFGSLLSLSDDGKKIGVGGSQARIYRLSDDGDYENYHIHYDESLDKIAVAISGDGNSAVIISKPGVALIYNI